MNKCKNIKRSDFPRKYKYHSRSYPVKIDIARLIFIYRYVDMLNLMTYNFYGPWSAYTGQNSPLYASSIESNYEMTHLNVNASVNKWINAGASPRKINVGLAFYGRSYTLTNYTQHGLHAPFSKSHCGVYTYRQVWIIFYLYLQWRDEYLTERMNLELNVYIFFITYFRANDSVIMMFIKHR